MGYMTGIFSLRGALAAAAALSCFAAAPAAHADCRTEHTQAACDGKNPELEGCTLDAVLKGSAPFTDEARRQVGIIDHFYSAACNSSWGATTVFLGNGASIWYAAVLAFRSDGTGSGFTALGTGASRTVSPMAFIPSGTAYAQGNVRVASGRFAVARTPTAMIP